jgi:hypothetical protein
MQTKLLGAQMDSIFTTSFKHTSNVLYRVEFTNSNALETIEKLNILKYNIENKITTGKHVGAPIYIEDVLLALNTLTHIVSHYKKITNLPSIAENTKIYKMTDYIKLSEQVDVKVIAKEVVNEVLNPAKEVKKLTKKEKIKEGADLKSQERKLELLKKQGRV